MVMRRIPRHIGRLHIARAQSGIIFRIPRRRRVHFARLHIAGPRLMVCRARPLARVPDPRLPKPRIPLADKSAPVLNIDRCRMIAHTELRLLVAFGGGQHVHAVEPAWRQRNRLPLRHQRIGRSCRGLCKVKVHPVERQQPRQHLRRIRIAFAIHAAARCFRIVVACRGKVVLQRNSFRLHRGNRRLRRAHLQREGPGLVPAE